MKDARDGKFNVNNYYKLVLNDRVGTAAKCIQVTDKFIKMQFLMLGKKVKVKYKYSETNFTLNHFVELTPLEKELM